jgi:N-methylhydantoinase A
LLGGAWVETALYDRGDLGLGHRLQGPAIVEQMDSTTLILPGQSAHIDTYGNIVIEEAVV